MSRGGVWSYLPAAGFEHLRQTEFIRAAQAQKLIYFNQKVVEEAYSDCAPFDNDVVVGSEHGNNLHTWLSFLFGIALILCQAAFCVFGLQCQETYVDEESTVSVFWQAGQKFGTGKVNVE